MNILLIGVYADPKLIEYINLRSSKDSSVSMAAVKYTELIKKGIEAKINNKCSSLFLAPIGMFPKSKILIWKTRSFKNVHYIIFLNFIFIKHIIISLYVLSFCFIWYLRNFRDKNKIIVMTSVYAPFLLGVMPMKIFKDVFIASFVPDMPKYEFTYSKKVFNFKNLVVPIYVYFANLLVSICDYFVFLTKYMVDDFPSRPSCIIEGFVDSKEKEKEISNVSNKNAIMYSGALFEKYGILNLIKAFMQVPGDYELWLFGYGDLETEITKYATVDLRIKFFGSLPNSDIVCFQRKAKLLVNPRFSHYEYTKFSFPSKLLEYMVSGTPVLTTKLPGIPEEYRDKMFFIEDESIEGIRKSLIHCLSKSQDDLNAFGFNSRNYVLENKNNIMLMDKLIQDLEIVAR